MKQSKKLKKGYPLRSSSNLKNLADDIGDQAYAFVSDVLELAELLVMDLE